MSRRYVLVATIWLAAGVLARCGWAEDEVRLVADVSYKSGELSDYERTRCKLDLYLPAEGAEDFATVVWFHGGGIQGGDKQSEIAVNFARRFAREGVAVASVNYRLSPQVTYPAYLDDAAAAVAFVHRQIARHGGSPERVFVSGHSAGGYLSAMVAVDPKYLAKYDVKPTQLAGAMPVSGQMITHSTVRGEREIPRTRPIIDEAAPSYYAGKGLPPLLAIVGGEDLPARAEENRYFVAAMRAAGHDDVEYFEVADRTHSTIANRLGEVDDAVAEKMLAFIKRLGGE